MKSDRFVPSDERTFLIRAFTVFLLYALICLAPGCGGDATSGASVDAGSPFATLPIVPGAITKATVPVPPEMTGGIGSGLAFDPTEGVYWMVTDQQPAGQPDWPLYLYQVRVTAGRAEIVAAIPIKDGGKHVLGGELDPEGVALAPDGTIWMSDEGAPFLIHLTRRGEILEKVAPTELLRGREKNRGLEGVAVSPDGSTVFAILQNAPEGESDRLNTVLVSYDVRRRVITHHRYRLEDPAAFDFPANLMVAPRAGAHDLHALDGRTLLVLERDNQSAEAARIKRVFRVEVPPQVGDGPLSKTLVIDLRKLGYTFEAPEGLTLRGPRTLAVANDNDGLAEMPTEIWEIAF